jgi:hypothetical protein
MDSTNTTSLSNPTALEEDADQVENIFRIVSSMTSQSWKTMIKSYGREEYPIKKSSTFDPADPYWQLMFARTAIQRAEMDKTGDVIQQESGWTDRSSRYLHAVSRAVLTVEFFPSEIMYSFSWKENRGALDRLECKEKLIVPTDQGCTGYKKADAQSSATPATIHKATKAHTPFSQEELALLKQLKEED